MDKKAFLAEGPLTIYMILFHIFIIIIFALFFTFSTDPKKAEINSVSADMNTNTILLNYLRTPVDSGTIADLLIQSSINQDFESLQEKTQNLLDIYPVTYYVVEIFSGGENIGVLSPQSMISPKNSPVPKATVKLPSPNKKIITVILSISEGETIQQIVAEQQATQFGVS